MSVPNMGDPKTRAAEARRQRQLSSCIHWTGISFTGDSRGRCKVGVPYDNFEGDNGILFGRLPCINNGPDTCRLREFPTPESVEQEEREWLEILEKTTKAQKAAKEDARALGLGRGNGGGGQVPCPACSGGTLVYRVASINGHMHAGCSTQGCVSWME